MASFSEILINAGIRAQYNNANALGSLAFIMLDRDQVLYETGTGAGKVDMLHASNRTLVASATENLDLSGTTLLDPYNTALTFARIKIIHVRAAVGNTNNVLVGGAGANAFLGPFGGTGETHAIRPGGGFLAFDIGLGWAVTAGTGDLFKFANSGAGTSVSFDVEIVGASA